MLQCKQTLEMNQDFSALTAACVASRLQALADPAVYQNITNGIFMSAFDEKPEHEVHSGSHFMFISSHQEISYLHQTGLLQAT
jgi:hypothetical protein